MNLGSGCSVGNIIHEFGHSLGLMHEHQRADRDGFVAFHPENVDRTVLVGQADVDVNFAKWTVQGLPGADFKTYDFGSIMHYSSSAFADGGPTLTTLNGDEFDSNRDALSWGDRSAIVAMYLYNPAEAIRFKAVSSNKCLDMPPNALLGQQEGWSLAQQFGCHNGTNQKWDWYPLTNGNEGLMINGQSKLCLHAEFVGSTGRVKESPCTGASNQRWALFDVGARIRNIATNRCLDVEGGIAVLGDGVPVNHFACLGQTNQQWSPF